MNWEVMFKINFQVCYHHGPPWGYLKEMATGKTKKEKQWWENGNKTINS